MIVMNGGLFIFTIGGRNGYSNYAKLKSEVNVWK